VGSIDYYVYYKAVGEGYSLGKCRTNDTIIIESDTETPKRVIYRKTTKDSIWWLGPKGIWLQPKRLRKIYVPKGTIIRNFKLE